MAAAIVTSGATPLARFVLEHRLEKGWTQAQLANKAGLVERTIRRVEDGQPVRQITVARIATALGVPVSLLTQLG